MALPRKNTPSACNVCGTPVDPERWLTWVKHGHPILRCSNCGLRFRGDLPDPDDLAALYAEEYFRAGTEGTRGEGYPDYVGDEDLHRANARRRLDQLTHFVRRGRLIDVGCAAGFFLDEAARRGFSVTGVELAPSMARFAREGLRLDVIEAPFAEAVLSDDWFECVTMWDYLEHSIDPAADLKRAGELLRPGGVLALSTGDVGSVVARVSGSRWHLLTPQHHNYFFDRKTIREALHRAGFDIRSLSAPASWYSLAYLAHKLQTVGGLPLLERFARAVGRSRFRSISLPVNLWDILTVVAERRSK